MREDITILSEKIKHREEGFINADFRFRQNGKNLPLLIFCHGFKGFKDWGCFPYLLESIAEEDVFTVGFNFTYNGVGDDPVTQTEFTRPELFAKNTFTRELDDLGQVMNYLSKHRAKYNYNFDNLILVGHSRGGGIAIIKASEDSRVKKLITIASISHFDRYSTEQKKKWKAKGYMEVLNSRTNQLIRMNYTLLEDLEKNKERLNILKAMSKLKIPTLIIHGMEDLSVSVAEAEHLYSISNKQITKLRLYENAGHTFGAVHPCKGTSTALENVIWDMVEFIKEEKDPYKFLQSP